MFERILLRYNSLSPIDHICTVPLFESYTRSLSIYCLKGHFGNILNTCIALYVIKVKPKWAFSQYYLMSGSSPKDTKQGNTGHFQVAIITVHLIMDPHISWHIPWCYNNCDKIIIKMDFYDYRKHC